MILDFSETQDLFKISRVCRNVYSAALVVLRGRISSLRDGPGFNVALRIREPVMLAPPVYRQCRYVGQVQAQRYYDGSEIDRRGGLARCCDVFFRMIPSACDETPEGVTVKAVTIINTVHPPEINRSSPIEYSLDCKPQSVRIQLLYTLQFLIAGQNDAIAAHHGEVEIHHKWLEQLASSRSLGTPGPTGPSKSRPRPDKRRFAFPVLEDPTIAWDLSATIGFKLEAERIGVYGPERLGYLLKIEGGLNCIPYHVVSLLTNIDNRDLYSCSPLASVERSPCASKYGISTHLEMS